MRLHHGCAGGVTPEAALVLALLVLILFILFPPILRLLTEGSQVTKGENAIVAVAGRQVAIIGMDTSGRIAPIEPTRRAYAMDALNGDVGISTGRDAESASALIYSPDSLSAENSDEVVACRKYPSFTDCSLTPSPNNISGALLKAAQDHPKHPYNLMAAVGKNLDSGSQTIYASGPARPDNVALSDNARPLQVNTPVGYTNIPVTATPTDVPSITPSSVPATSTATNTPTSTATTSPTGTSTSTPVPPTNTSTPVPTDTNAPTSTPTTAPTNTSVPPTMPVPTNTPISVYTPIEVPTDTPIPVYTPIGSGGSAFNRWLVPQTDVALNPQARDAAPFQHVNYLP